jgi:hypothetical protein
VTPSSRKRYEEEGGGRREEGGGRREEVRVERTGRKEGGRMETEERSKRYEEGKGEGRKGEERRNVEGGGRRGRVVEAEEVRKGEKRERVVMMLILTHSLQAPAPDSCLGLPHASVLTENGLVYDVLLTKTDVRYGQYGTNNFYVLQVCGREEKKKEFFKYGKKFLKISVPAKIFFKNKRDRNFYFPGINFFFKVIYERAKGIYLVFTRWGRAGTQGQYQKTAFPYVRREKGGGRKGMRGKGACRNGGKGKEGKEVKEGREGEETRKGEKRERRRGKVERKGRGRERRGESTLTVLQRDKAEAITEFGKIFKSKTGNSFEKEMTFEKQPKKWRLQETKRTVKDYSAV